VAAAAANQCERCGGSDERTVLLDAEDQRTILMSQTKSAPPIVDSEVEDDQRTVLITGRPPRPISTDDEQRTVIVTPELLHEAPRRPAPVPAPPAQRASSAQQPWGTPPGQAAPPHQTATPPPRQATPPPPRPVQRPDLTLADGYPEELTTSLTGSLLGARAAPPRPVPKTSYRMVVPVLIIALLLAIVVGVAITMVASGAIEGFFDSIIRAS
jgi:hypothetical protein